MSEQTTEKPEVPSYLEMSDEEIMAMPAPVAEAPVSTAAATDQAVDVLKAPAEMKLEDEVKVDQLPVVDKAAKGEAKAAGGTPDAKAEADTTGNEDKTLKVPNEPGTEKPASELPKVDLPKEPIVIDYEAEYKRILAPFKANGREIQVGTVEDAVALMQMGANYSKKMSALKPNLKLMKSLENNGLLNEEKIGFLIDLSKKDPAAISKLVKDSGLDPMDLDADKAGAYKQTAYAVDDREIELDTVLDELQGSPTYTRTLDVVSNKWDVASKQAVSQNPQLLKLLNDHMAGGIYDLISTEIERERVFGRLKGMSDIEAYKQVGDAINARGGFNHLVKDQGKPAPKAVEVVVPKPKAAEDDALKDKRRAASSTKTAAPSATPQDFNPLALSDADFSKLTPPKFA